jgi:hypothetical protein
LPRTDPGRPQSAQRFTVVESWSGSPGEIAQDLGVVPHADLPRAHRSRCPTRSNSRPSHREQHLALSVEICAVATRNLLLARRGTVPRYRPTDRHSAVRPRVTKRPTGAHDVDGVAAMCSSCGFDWTPNDLLRLHDAYLEHNTRLTYKARVARPGSDCWIRSRRRAPAGWSSALDREEDVPCAGSLRRGRRAVRRAPGETASPAILPRPV